MKTILKLTTVVALMLSTVVGLAEETKLNVVALTNAKSLLLTLENGSNDLDIRLVDSDMNLIHAETITNSTVSKKFDLRNLNDGTYYFYTSDDFKNYRYTMAIADNVLRILDIEESVKPYFRKTRNKIYMNFLNLNKAPVEIKVYDADYRLVFSETRNEELIVEKAFNFSDAFAGSYTVVITDSKSTYTEDFTVD
ncbi:hypothetical protein [Maribacter sp. R77961]|jgi:hypothetical protein|uniref:hypothetical protein n=1 Tax=Maribacter sp. R77961 TaxID=3093871 RepID=UPI0037CABBEE